MRKAKDDALARTVAEREVGDILEADGFIDSAQQELIEAGRSFLGRFDAVEFERATTKVGGEVIPLRRIVVTGPWEVDPDGPPAGASAV